ncbi:MAG: hypothetical protein DRJ03_31320 [Chloroflexi bacterium]|nr:MAG: hypothetical protein DRJ03_31320 [Chloroflexota bacterium]RLI55224.1 MAG: hypothetical protein DRP09_10440 [Candidatus Thorarchaeota archaeon]
MDKKERSQIVAVKLEEVLNEERRKLSKEHTEFLKTAEKTERVQELKRLKENFEQFMEEKKRKKKLIDEAIEQFNKDHEDQNLKANIHWDYHENNITIDILLREQTEIPYVCVEAGSIVTSVTKLRNHENERIRTVAREGFELVVEDNEEQLQKFLRL